MDPVLFIDHLFTGTPWGGVILWALFVIAVMGLVRREWKPFRRFINTMDQLAELPEFASETKAMLERLRAQVENSHNTNFRDDVTALGEDLREVKESVDGVHGRLDRVETGVAGLYGKVDELEAADHTTSDRIKDIEKTIPRDQLGRFTSKEKE
jgi:Protein of unknown function (DUF2746).